MNEKIWILAIATVGLLPSASAFAQSSQSERPQVTTQRADAEFAGTPEQGDLESTGSFTLNYSNLLNGPALKEPSRYQPTADGKPDFQRPVELRNFLSLGYAVDDSLSLSGTGAWAVESTPKGQVLELRDPYVQISHNSLINTDSVNLYGDVRAIFPVSPDSREQDMLGRVQSFQALTFMPDNSRFWFGTHSWARVNVFGSQGVGSDLELYLGPNVNYRIAPTVALNLVYEFHFDHIYGTQPGQLKRLPDEIEAGLSWDITPSLTINPYLNIFTSNGVSLASTAIGAWLGWQMI